MEHGAVTWQERQAEAVRVLRHCRELLSARGSSVRHEITAGASAITPWQRYPEDEVYDPQSHAQYFYHCHAEPFRNPDGRWEDGHFHLFLRADGMPPGIDPVVLPELAVAGAPLPRQSMPRKRGSRDELSHLVAIGLDDAGEPTRLFTTNRWVTGESWYRADDVIRMVERFRVAQPETALVNDWLGAVLRLFEPEIAVLLRNRDKAIADWRWRWRGQVFEDPRLEIASSFAVDLDARLAAVEQAPQRAARSSRPTLLPPMAEGWGASS